MASSDPQDTSAHNGSGPALADPSTSSNLGGRPLATENSISPDSPEAYLNRELSWLEFNRRVLAEALHNRTPLLSRVMFLGIFTSNLDEFVMKRVGGLKRQVAEGIVSRSPDGMTQEQQLAAMREYITEMLQVQAKCFANDIRPALEQHGIELVGIKDLTPGEYERANAYFRDNVFPVLTPLSVDPGHPFPFISNLSTSLGVILKPTGRENDEKQFARVKVPKLLPQWIRIEDLEGDGKFRFLNLMELIEDNLDQLFPGMDVIDVMAFRITRNADVERDEDDAEDLLSMMAQEIRQRRFEKAIRLEHGPEPNPWMLRFLMQELDLSANDVYLMPELLDYTDLSPVVKLNLPELQPTPWKPLVPSLLADEESNFFTVVRSGDLLVHHPYESFAASVERFIRAAADDPKVVAIKMTLYRTGDNSPFIHTLIRAAESGKQVACLVELKARFDEERNIQWAQALEKAGVHVVYGVVGLKTHTKTALVIRQESDGLRAYAHIGTGNYHAGTSRLYTDLGLFTSRKEWTQDVMELFNFLTGHSLKTDYKKLLVAPLTMRDRFIQMIDREIEHQQAGRPAGIIAKMNALQDRAICEKLYEASSAGVSIELIVRGFCCIRPGVPGLSDNIKVSSIIGRFLEHSRIYYFRNGQEDWLQGEFYIGSADWMTRNLSERVEAVTPIELGSSRERLWEIIEIMRNDQRQCWDMNSDGTYTQRRPKDPEATDNATLGTHESLMRLTRQRQGFIPE